LHTLLLQYENRVSGPVFEERLFFFPKNGIFPFPVSRKISIFATGKFSLRLVANHR
jgi:hypothetical protein